MPPTLTIDIEHDTPRKILRRAPEETVNALKKMWELCDQFLVLYTIVADGVTDLTQRNKLIMSLCRVRSNRIEQERADTFHEMRLLFTKREHKDSSVCQNPIWNADVVKKQKKYVMSQIIAKKKKEAA